MLNYKVNVFSFLSLLISYFCYSQHSNLPLKFQLNQRLYYNHITSNNKNNKFHNSSRPFIKTFTPVSLYDNIYNDTGKYYYAFTEKLYQKNLLDIEESGLKLVADPIFNFSYGRNYIEDTIYKISTNIRGVRVAGDITNKLSFETSVYEMQKFYPKYIDSVANYKNTAIGFGRSKKFKNTGHDVAMSLGYFSYSPNRFINIQLGQGKHFIGNGYRSILLSDNAAPYPYISFTTNLFKNKIQYKNINSWNQSLYRIPVTNSAEALFKRKGASFRYLSFIITNKLQLGFFEGTIYQNYEDSIGQIPLSPLFYTPIIGVNSIINGLSGVNNSILGLNFNYKIINRAMFYGQIMLDDKNKNGHQIGLKWFKFLNIKNSWVQLEYNNVSPSSYSQNKKYILQTYTHTNQELAHPLGANFKEYILSFCVERNRWFARGKFIYYNQKSKSVEGLESNILVPIGTASLENYNRRVYHTSLEISYLFNRKTNMQIFAYYGYRDELHNYNINKNVINNFESFFTIGFRTNLINIYEDI